MRTLLTALLLVLSTTLSADPILDHFEGKPFNIRYAMTDDCVAYLQRPNEQYTDHLYVYKSHSVVITELDGKIHVVAYHYMKDHSAYSSVVQEKFREEAVKYRYDDNAESYISRDNKWVMIYSGKGKDFAYAIKRR